MNADNLLDAFSELEEGAVRSAGALLGFEEERMRTRKPVKIIIRAVLIAAILATLSIGAAYAMGLFTMDIRTPEAGEELVGHYTYYDPAQQKDVTEETDLSNATLVLQLDGAGENHKVRFRPGWLPDFNAFSIIGICLESSTSNNKHKSSTVKNQNGINNFS